MTARRRTPAPAHSPPRFRENSHSELRASHLPRFNYHSPWPSASSEAKQGLCFLLLIHSAALSSCEVRFLLPPPMAPVLSISILTFVQSSSGASERVRVPRAAAATRKVLPPPLPLLVRSSPLRPTPPPPSPAAHLSDGRVCRRCRCRRPTCLNIARE